MTRNLASAIALAACFGLTSAQQLGPHIGAGFVWYPSLLADMPDSVGGLKPSYALEDMFTGASITAEYWPYQMIGARVTLVQIQFFAEGGSALALLPRAGVDLLVAPPVDWRVRPLVAAGLSTTWYRGGVNRGDARFLFDPDVHFWIGPGLSIRVTRRLAVCVEAGVYDVDRYYIKDPDLGYYQWTNSGVVVDHALVGLTWACREPAQQSP